jgi:hypothetical protein
MAVAARGSGGGRAAGPGGGAGSWCHGSAGAGGQPDLTCWRPGGEAG